MLSFELNDLKQHLTKRNGLILIGFLFPIILTFIVFFSQGTDEFSQVAETSYVQLNTTARCSSGSRDGDEGATHGEESREGIKYNVRAPKNYDSTIAHPLLMVYAPASANRAKMERISNLTYEATKAGFIIAYADHPELSPTSSIELGTIPGLISKKWCVDPQRIFLTGHSDGGSAAMALAFMTGTKNIPSAIAPSAAGINYLALRSHKCPAPIPVMVMHSRKDRLFPGFGVESAGWWADCNKCSPVPEDLGNGCVAYGGCANGVKTWYCEGEKSHSKWPGINKAILEFFLAYKPKKLQ